MEYAAIVQARMSSTRLPGKVLKRLGEKPLLGHLLDRVERASRVNKVVVATSAQPSDDPIAEYCRSRGVSCCRGPLHDVAQRFLLAMETCPAHAYIRLCADSPIMDPEVVNAVVGLFEAKKPDLATNVFPRSFPAGLSVEVIHPASFRKAAVLFSTAAHREHVTRFFYEHPARFRIANLTNPAPMPLLDLSVNTQAQWEQLLRLWGHFGTRWSQVGWREVVAYLMEQASGKVSK